MIVLGNISIGRLNLDDALSLNQMLLKNTDRFQRFFPKTIKENLNLEMTKKYILTKSSLIEKGQEYSLGIKDYQSGDVIGLIILKNIDRNRNDAEVAYCIDEAQGGQGIMTKTVDQICHFALNEVDLNSLYIYAHKTNIPSVRMAEKSGFKWAETKLKFFTPPGEEPLDMELFVKQL